MRDRYLASITPLKRQGLSVLRFFENLAELSETEDINSTNTIKISSLKLGDKKFILKVGCIHKSNLRQSDKTNGYRFHVDIKDESASMHKLFQNAMALIRNYRNAIFLYIKSYSN